MTIDATAVPSLPAAVRAFLDDTAASIVIDGERREAQSGERLPVYDPGTATVIAEVAAGDAADVDAAVRSARRTFDEDWRHRTPVARSRALLRLADLIEEQLDELAVLETLDNGKPLLESTYVDLASTAEIYRYYGGWVTKLGGDVLPVSPPVGSAHAFTRREPFGVVGAIVPWNFPMALTSFKVAPALAAGNCVVVKSAEQTPLSAIRLAELAVEAGFPPGALNTVSGLGPTAGAALVAHPMVGTVGFTGSTATGRKVMEAAVAGPKPVHLELGGKSPNIIFADADLDLAVQGAFLGIFLNQGQVCCAGSRLYVQRDVFDDVVNRLVDLAQEVQLGHGLDPRTQMGPLVSDEQLARVGGFVDRARASGAEIACGGQAAADAGSGWFYRPTVVTGTTDDMEIAREEVFGPVVVAMPFGDEDEVVARANGSAYGLAAGVWTENLSRAHRVAALLDAGTVWVNSYLMIDPVAPFGGFKASGFGRDLGGEALHQYTQTKSVWIQLD